MYKNDILFIPLPVTFRIENILECTCMSVSESLFAALGRHLNRKRLITPRPPNNYESNYRPAFNPKLILIIGARRLNTKNYYDSLFECDLKWFFCAVSKDRWGRSNLFVCVQIQGSEEINKLEMLLKKRSILRKGEAVLIFTNIKEKIFQVWIPTEI